MNPIQIPPIEAWEHDRYLKRREDEAIKRMLVEQARKREQDGIKNEIAYIALISTPFLIIILRIFMG